MFDKYCVDKILSGEKTVTRRIHRGFNKNDELIYRQKRPAVPGRIHKIKIDRTKKTYGYIKIKSCTKEILSKGLSDINEVYKEGFTDRNEYIDYFKKVNNLKYPNNWVWRVEFEYLGDSYE